MSRELVDSLIIGACASNAIRLFFMRPNKLIKKIKVTPQNYAIIADHLKVELAKTEQPSQPADVTLTQAA
jgi:hypothetical protein